MTFRDTLTNAISELETRVELTSQILHSIQLTIDELPEEARPLAANLANLIAYTLVETPSQLEVLQSTLEDFNMGRWVNVPAMTAWAESITFELAPMFGSSAH